MNQSPYNSQFIIQERQATQGAYLNKKVTYNDLLLYEGQFAKDYTDISQIAKNFYSSQSTTLSGSVGFQDWIMGAGGVEFIDSNEARWKVHYKPERKFYSLGNPNTVSKPFYGQGGMPFQIKLSMEGLSFGDVVAPKRNKRAGLIIQGDGRGVGGAWVYDVVIFANPSYESAFNAAYLTKNNDEWEKIGAVASDKGSLHYSGLMLGYNWAWLEYSVKMTTAQYKFSIEQEAHEKFGNLEIARCDEYGKPMKGTTKITNYLEMEAKTQMDEETDKMLLYGEATEHLTGLRGELITTSPGLFQWFSESNEYSYKPTSRGFKQIIKTISNLWFDRIQISQRRLVLYTGEGGIEVFNEFVREEFGDSAVSASYDFVLGESPAFEPGRKGFEYAPPQFTKYKLPTFGEISLVHWPLLDNTRVNGAYYPGTNKPASSYEFLAFDYGFGKPNIRLLKRNNRDFSTIQPGMYSPYGMVGEQNPVFKQPGDPTFFGYHWLSRHTFGLVVIDPKRMVRFFPDVVG
jgi:hypothetical protein